MKQTAVMLGLLLLLVGCSDNVQVTEDFKIVKDGNEFSCALVSNLFLYTEDDDDIFSQITLAVKQNGRVKTYNDATYPFEFTVPVSADKIEFKVGGRRKNWVAVSGNWITLNK